MCGGDREVVGMDRRVGTRVWRSDMGVLLVFEGLEGVCWGYRVFEWVQKVVSKRDMASGMVGVNDVMSLSRFK